MCGKVHKQEVAGTPPRLTLFLLSYFTFFHFICLFKIFIDVLHDLKGLSGIKTNNDLLENGVPYDWQNIRQQIIHYTCCLNLSSLGKCLKKSMQEVLALTICES